ncbi:carbamoyl-phosphate synthase large chain [Algimonas ampicilliniresistens]|uniref:Carbamoyl phosphate synthase large chain n=1 Tax=Algimonas ampicilliniresistens TaxID=1298735 RepID=A0ABQ5VC16_9PROT|nr:carbamoyl-phosphate synthase large subunit [Algimonas ampicilliniresistens]GLQ24627.1 carbamoyl-phosphate synthase large chain [Algimonas ampicilliniresistens]
MPKRTDIHSILIIGAGPIIIGQACEFDYSGVQACKALREEGYRVILVNSNPATIMTDPDMADATYVEPITPEIVEKIIAIEKPDALLPTMGGQTALNCALALEQMGVLDKYGVEMIGAKADVIDKAENRERFAEAMTKIGLENPRATIVTAPTREDGEVDITAGVAEAMAALDFTGLPAIIRPAFTMGGTGGGVAYNIEEYREIIRSGLSASPTNQVLVDESLLGWKEYEMEVVRDRADNCIIICSIENIDPMGVHTGDSITVAPALTLTDKEYQIMRDASIAVLREIGVETGGSNVQFGINPIDGRMVVIEMNPRVSRSSALASKATGFPIAKIAAKLAVGYTLDELDNDITGATPAAFEPTIDYVVTKIPRFAFEKFPGAESVLTTAMKSVGEAMAIGRTFAESFQKALRSLETGLTGLNEIDFDDSDPDALKAALKARLSILAPDRLLVIAQAFRHGMSVEKIFQYTSIDPWFLRQIETLVKAESWLAETGLPKTESEWRAIKAEGFSDARIGELTDTKESNVRKARQKAGVRPVYKRVDTCAAEFAAKTPYMYSTYETPSFGGVAENEARVSDKQKVVILGGGPNRIGQGIEFDYCCVHAAYAMADLGIESIMVNCNPETVSTDYDTSDRLYFEPLTEEDVLELIQGEMASGELLGVVVQFGGQTPLKLASTLEKAGIPLLGTPSDALDRAEDRERFKALVEKLGLRQPNNAIARTVKEAKEAAATVGFPLVLRPSNVLGGRGMEIVDNDAELNRYVTEAVKVSGKSPLLIDQYLRDAVEVDVDAICDGTDVFVAGIMEHIEEAGVHSGDSACSLPPYTLSDDIQDEMRRQARLLALELGVVGLMNIQFAVKGDLVYLIEVNPRASRTVPFVAKAIGLPVANIAAKVMAGKPLSEFDLSTRPQKYIAVKEAVFPFARFPGVDTVLGPEMRSTGEVMGLADTFGVAFAKSQLGGGVTLPDTGTAFISVKEEHKPLMAELAQDLIDMGFSIMATGGTTKYLRAQGIEVDYVKKFHEGRPNIVDAMKNGKVQLVFNTTEGKQALKDSFSLRRTALDQKIPYFTTAAASRATVEAIKALKAGGYEVESLQSIAAG